MKNTKKTANKLPVPGKVRKGFRFSGYRVVGVGKPGNFQNGRHKQIPG